MAIIILTMSVILCATAHFVSHRTYQLRTTEYYEQMGHSVVATLADAFRCINVGLPAPLLMRGQERSDWVKGLRYASIEAREGRCGRARGGVYPREWRLCPA